MFASGIIVALGLVMLFCKTSWKTRMRLLSYPLTVDIVVFVGLTMLHWGSYTGVMAATFGALITSILLTIGRRIFGHITNGKYVRGWSDVGRHITWRKHG